jgi:hypothetical protein
MPANNFYNNLRPWNTTYITITYNELYAIYAKATEPANLLLAETESIWARNYYTSRYALDAEKRSIILLRSPFTGGNWAMENQLYTAGTGNYLIPKINEYFVKASVNAEIGYPHVMVPLFTVEELLFNRAEAYTYLGRTTEAMADLATFASRRIKDYNPANHTVTAAKLTGYYGGDLENSLIEAILDFKRVEFVQEGMRWFDILRYKIPVTHVEKLSGRVIRSFPLKDLNRVFQIPESAGLSGVPQNPR